MFKSVNHNYIMSVEMNKTSDRDIKKEIADIVKLPPSDKWDVFDEREEEGLYLIHSIIEPKIQGLPRGMVVDVNNKIVVCDSFGFTPTSTLDELTVNTTPTSSEPCISIVDEYINRHTFSEGKYEMYPAYEGVIVRAFKHNGNVYFSTHKRLDCSRSRWGNSDRFLDMYKRLGGLDGDHLFPKDVITSPFVYQFLLVDKDLLVATQQDIGEGFIVHLKTVKMWDYGDDSPFSPSETGTQHFEPVIHDKWISPKSLSLEEANKFLKYGYNDSDKISFGESVIIYNYDDKGKVIDSLRIHSSSYNYRVEMRGNNPNLRHRFYQLMNDAIKYEDLDKLVTKYPLFYRKGGRRPLHEIYVEHNNQHKKLNLNRVDDRIFLVYASYFRTLPLSQKEEGIKLWTNFKSDRAKVIKWLQNLALNGTSEEIDELSERSKAIISITSSYAKNRMKTGRNRNKRGNRMTYPQVLSANVYNLILKENGPSLFKLIREMKQLEKEYERKGQSNDASTT